MQTLSHCIKPDSTTLWLFNVAMGNHHFLGTTVNHNCDLCASQMGFHHGHGCNIRLAYFFWAQFPLFRDTPVFRTPRTKGCTTSFQAALREAVWGFEQTTTESTLVAGPMFLASAGPYTHQLHPGLFQQRAHCYIHNFTSTCPSSSCCFWHTPATYVAIEPYDPIWCYILRNGIAVFDDSSWTTWCRLCEGHLPDDLQQQAGRLQGMANNKSKEATINLMTSLSGIAWRQIEHLVDKASEAEDGFMLILSELDTTFLSVR